MRIVEYLSGLVITSIVAGLLGLLVVVCIAGVAFGFNVFGWDFTAAVSRHSLHISPRRWEHLVSGVIFRLGPAAEWLGWPVPLVLPSCRGILSINTLPLPFQFVAKLIPASWVFESVRAVLTNSASAAQTWSEPSDWIGFGTGLSGRRIRFFARNLSTKSETGAIAVSAPSHGKRKRRPASCRAPLKAIERDIYFRFV